MHDYLLCSVIQFKCRFTHTNLISLIMASLESQLLWKTLNMGMKADLSMTVLEEKGEASPQMSKVSMLSL